MWAVLDCVFYTFSFKGSRDMLQQKGRLEMKLIISFYSI